jgi:hypothetical protein
LFFLLRKIGMTRADIVVLQRYNITTYMIIVHGDGVKSSRIPLRHGLRQGCPLSPILGSFVVNVLIRWIDDHGGGLHHPSGVESTVTAFCDDLTLTTEDVTSMKGLFQRVYDYCQWTGVNTDTQTYSTSRIGTVPGHTHSTYTRHVGRTRTHSYESETVGEDTFSTPLQSKTNLLGDTVGTVVHHQLFCSISALGRRVVAVVGECGMAGTT